MLHNSIDLKGYTLHCLDGAIGKVKEFFFDDHHWTIRYLVAENGNWLTGRQVLISPHALAGVDVEQKFVAVNLTKKQIEKSPLLESDKPVSRQFEKAYYGHFGWPMYWEGSYMWGPYPDIVYDRKLPRVPSPGGKIWDPYLRSTHDVIGHHIHATDGELGQVVDFIIDDETWAIRYMIVSTQDWWPGKKVLVSPKWIDSVSWSESKVFVKISREAVRDSPEYVEERPPTPDYESRLHEHYENRKAFVDTGCQ